MVPSAGGALNWRRSYEKCLGVPPCPPVVPHCLAFNPLLPKNTPGKKNTKSYSDTTVMRIIRNVFVFSSALRCGPSRRLIFTDRSVVGFFCFSAHAGFFFFLPPSSTAEFNGPPRATGRLTLFGDNAKLSVGRRERERSGVSEWE